MKRCCLNTLQSTNAVGVPRSYFSEPMLPFNTVEAAEAALGRSLTAAETIWLSYSADKSDYFLYCHNILFLFLLFSLFPFYYLFLEYFFKDVIAPYKIQPKAVAESGKYIED